MLIRNRESPDQRSHSVALSELTGQTVCSSEFVYRRGAEIFGEAESADYLFHLKSGAVRSYKLLPDGRRQITAFHLPGDIFGVENGPTHRFTAEAISETTVHLTRRRDNADRRDGQPAATNNVLRLVTRNLQHAETHMLLLGRKTSLEKVAAFLLEMDERLTAAGIMSLPMGRRDIADYLGLTVETVSRAMSHLKDRGVLSFIGQTHREIRLQDRTKLARFDS
jgi:CRP/FNR family nitrogen fixation transcriptional regulator